MNRLTRYFTLPLVFASIAVSAVVLLGEPVQAAAAPAPRVVLPTVVVESTPPSSFALTQDVLAAAQQRAERAAKMRWRITLPGSQRRVVFRRPV